MHFPLGTQGSWLSDFERELNRTLKAMGLSEIKKPLPTESMEACMSQVKQEHSDWKQEQRVAACLNATGQSSKMHFPIKDGVTSNTVGAYNATAKPAKKPTIRDARIAGRAKSGYASAFWDGLSPDERLDYLNSAQLDLSNYPAPSVSQFLNKPFAALPIDLQQEIEANYTTM